VGNTAQYVAGTMPVAVPYYPNGADIREEHFVRVSLVIADLYNQEVTMFADAFHRQHNTNDVHALPERIRLLLPSLFHQYGFAQVGKRAC